MFDTVRLRARGIHVDPERLANLYHNNQDNITLRRNITGDGVVVTSYELHIDKQLSYIKYVATSGTLTIQVSISKFLHGDNITMVMESDVSRFFELLQAKLFDLLGVLVEHEQWITERVDLCYNFEVESVSDCMKQIAMLRLPRRNTVTYNHNETVVFKNKSNTVKFYDKEKECGDKRTSGIVRMEIEASYAELRKYSHPRRAVDLLTKRFFLNQMDYFLPQITEKLDGLNLEYFSDEWLRSESIQNIERAIGFRMLQQSVDESTLINLYKSGTYRSRLVLVKNIIPLKLNQFDLTIDDRKLG
jgi:hypothetical protein